jgi:high-affinity iron transporter
MLVALIIAFREVFEAGLIVGIVMAVTRAVAYRGWWVGGVVACGALAACGVALFTGALSATFGGSGQELFNAAILGIALVMLTWHNVWMARHGRQLATEMRAIGEAVVAGSRSLAGLPSLLVSQSCARVSKLSFSSMALRLLKVALAWASWPEV